MNLRDLTQIVIGAVTVHHQPRQYHRCLLISFGNPVKLRGKALASPREEFFLLRPIAGIEVCAWNVSLRDSPTDVSRKLGALINVLASQPLAIILWDRTADNIGVLQEVNGTQMHRELSRVVAEELGVQPSPRAVIRHQGLVALLAAKGIHGHWVTVQFPREEDGIGHILRATLSLPANPNVVPTVGIISTGRKCYSLNYGSWFENSARALLGALAILTTLEHTLLEELNIMAHDGSIDLCVSGELSCLFLDCLQALGQLGPCLGNQIAKVTDVWPTVGSRYLTFKGGVDGHWDVSGGLPSLAQLSPGDFFANDSRFQPWREKWVEWIDTRCEVEPSFNGSVRDEFSNKREREDDTVEPTTLEKQSKVEVTGVANTIENAEIRGSVHQTITIYTGRQSLAFEWTSIADWFKEKYRPFSLDMIADSGNGDEHKHPLGRRNELASTFVRLAIVKPAKPEDEEKQAKGMGRLRHHDLHLKKEPIALSALFAEPKNKRVMVQGGAGVGKSTTMKYICQRWALGDDAPQRDNNGKELWSPDFDAVILIELTLCRHALVPGKTWEAFLQTVLPPGIDADAFWKWAHANPRVLWILDGVDEVSSLIQTTILGSVLRDGDFFGAGRVLIGTRPEARSGVQNNLCVEIEGFTNADVIKYVLQYFDIRAPLPSLGVTLTHLSQEERESLNPRLVARIASDVIPQADESTESTRAGARILKFLESNKEVREMMRTPMNAELVCLAGLDLLKESSFSLTKLYFKVVKKIVSRTTSKLLTERRVLQLLCTAAWKSFHGGSGFVSSDLLESLIGELNVSATDEAACVELLERCSPWKHIGDSYFWMHFTFQEYLAAHYVCSFMEASMLEDALWGSLSFVDKKVLKRGVVFYTFTCGIAGGGEARNAKKVLEIIWMMIDRAMKSWPSDIKSWKTRRSAAQIIVELLRSDGHELLMTKLKETPVREDVLDSLLHRASEIGHLTLVDVLLFKGAHASIGLGGAAQGGHGDIVALLLKKGAHVRNGIYGAAWNAHAVIVDMLLEKGADPSEGVNGAARGGHMSIVETLLEKKAELGEALDGAARGGHLSIVAALLAKGADPTQGMEGAAIHGHSLIIRNLLDANADASDGIGGAARGGRGALVELLLNANADPSDGIGGAARGGHETIVELLLAKNADPDRGISGAARGGHGALVELLLNANADPSYGIAGAAEVGHMALVELLLAKGADPSKGIADAARSGHTALVELLLAKGANPSQGIAAAARGGHMAIVEMLLAKCADPNEGIRGASQGGHMAIVELLLAQGADPNEGIGFAAQEGHLILVELLLSKGADPKKGISGAAKGGH